MKFRMTPKRLAVLKSAATLGNVTRAKGAKTRTGFTYYAHGVTGNVTPQVEALIEAGMLTDKRIDSGFWSPTALVLTDKGTAAIEASEPVIVTPIPATTEETLALLAVIDAEATRREAKGI